MILLLLQLKVYVDGGIQWDVNTSYPDAKKLLITADCGGSNGSRVRLWKTELQKLADENPDWRFRLATFRPGTSKWNKIEHEIIMSRELL